MFNRWSNIGFVVAASLLIGLQTTAQAESQRGINTKENFFPRAKLWEFGGRLAFVERDSNSDEDSDDSLSATFLEPYLRYGISNELSLDVDLPIGTADSDGSGTDTGLGNIGIGLQLLAWQNVIPDTYIIPHAKWIIDSSDEGSGLDDGSGGVEFGFSLGTIKADIFHWTGDVSYEIRSDEDNLIRGSVTLITEMSDDFSLIAEASVSDEGDSEDSDTAVLLVGGFAYDWSENWQSSFYGGADANGDNDVLGMFKLSYAF